MNVSQESNQTLGHARRKPLGLLVGTLFGAVWAVVATWQWPQPARVTAWAAIALIVVVMAGWIFRHDVGAAIETPSPQQRRRTTRGFLLLLVGEIVAMNVAVMLFDHYQRPDWLMPAIAVIVGLHFLPMAPLLRVPVLRGMGSLMALWGVAAMVALALGVTSAPVLQAMELACAFTLWGSVFLRSRGVE